MRQSFANINNIAFNNKSREMYEQILRLSEEIKSLLKQLKQSYPKIELISQTYRLEKRMHEMVKSVVAEREKLPDFFQELHGTTVDMRLRMMAELTKQERKRKKLEDDYENLVNALRNSLINKDNMIKDLEDYIEVLKSSPKVQPSVSVPGPTGQEKHLEKQLALMQKKNDELKASIQELKNDLNAQQVKHKKQVQEIKRAQQLKNSKTKPAYSSLSPDKLPLNSNQSRYDNVLNSFSEAPIAQNFTELDNTFSQIQSDRKVKSVFAPNEKPKQADELWRFLYVQANAIEQLLTIDDDVEQ